MKSPLFSIIFVTTYLVIFTVMAATEADNGILFLMFSLSPFFIVWMVIVVLKYGKPSGKELNGNEWGYENIENHQFDTFGPDKRS